jgi:rRNA-processing protein EBP2
VAVEDEISSTKRPRTNDRDGGSQNHKRAARDAKYGHGGKKRYKKSGDAMSSGDLSGFSSKRMKSGGGGAAKKRPGKARRAGKR